MSEDTWTSEDVEGQLEMILQEAQAGRNSDALQYLDDLEEQIPPEFLPRTREARAQILSLQRAVGGPQAEPQPAVDAVEATPSPPSHEAEEIHQQIFIKLDPVRREVTQHRFHDAIGLLQDLLVQASPADRERLTIEEQKIRSDWEKYLSDLDKHITEAVDSTDQPLPTEIDTWVEEYRGTAPDNEETRQKLNAWLIAIEERRKRARLNERVKFLQESLNRLRQNGAMDFAAVDALLKQATEMRSSYPGDRQVESVVSGVKAYHDWVRSRVRAAELVTALQTAHFEEVLRIYHAAQQDGEERVPWMTPVIDPQGKFVLEWDEELEQEIIRLEPAGGGPIEIARAIEEAEQQARRWAQLKAGEKWSQAETILEEDPRQAERVVEEALALFMLPDPIRADLEGFRDSKVRPDVVRRGAAEKMRDASLVEVDIAAAWTQLENATNLDTHTPRLAEVRDLLRPRLMKYLEQEMNRAKRVQKQRQWVAARERAEPLLRLVMTDEALVEAWQGRIEAVLESCTRGEREDDSRQTRIQSIRGLMDKNPPEADAELCRLVKELGPDVELYPQLRDLRIWLDARLHIEDLLQQAQDTWGEGALEGMECVLKALDERLQTGDYDRVVLSDIRKWRNRLKARCMLRQADDSEWGGTQAQRLQNLQQVVDLLGEERDETYRGDLYHAREKRKEVEEDVKIVQQAQNSLSYATRLHQSGLAGRLEDLGQSWNMLRNLEEKVRQSLEDRTLPSDLFETVRSMREEVGKDYAQGLASEIETISRSPEEQWNIEKMEDDLAKLREADSSQGEQRDQQLLHRCYILRARRATSVDEALEWWSKARRLRIVSLQDRQRIEKGWRQVRRKQVLTSLGRHREDVSFQIGVLTELPDDIADDPDLRLRLAQLYCRRGDFDLAEGVIKEIEDALSLTQEAICGTEASQEQSLLRNEIKLLKKDIQNEREIQSRQAAIRQTIEMLNGVVGGEGVRDRIDKALSGVQELEEKFPERQSELGDWWTSLVDRTLEKLGEHYETLKREGQPLWKAASPIAIGVRLRPSWRLGEEVVADISQTVALGDLHQRIDEALNDRVRPQTTDKERALDEHIAYVQGLYDETFGYQQILHCAWTTERRGMVDEHVRRLEDRRKELVAVRTQARSVLANLQQAARSWAENDWDQVKMHLNPLITGPYQRHPQVLFVEDSCRAVEERMKQLQKCCEEIPSALQKEKLEQALSLVQQLRDNATPDPKSPDLARRYDYGCADFHLPLLQLQDVDLPGLETTISQRQREIQELEAWWQDSLAGLVPWEPFPTAWRDWMDGKLPEAAVGVAEQVARHIRLGEFAAALFLTAEAVGVSDEVMFERARKLAELLEKDDLAGALKFLQKPAGAITADHQEQCIQYLLGFCRQATIPGAKEPRVLQSGSLAGSRPLSAVYGQLQESPLPKNKPKSERALQALERGQAIREVVFAWLRAARQQMEDTADKMLKFQRQVRHVNDLHSLLAQARGRAKRNLLSLSNEAYAQACKIIGNNPAQPECDRLKRLQSEQDGSS